jgi:hypothetical protein
VATPDFATDIQPIFTRSCALGSGCHSAGGICSLVLEQGAAYDNLVDVPTVCASPPGLLRVRPGSLDSSLLALVIEDSARSISRMPFTGAQLPIAERGTIRNWIRQGAQP